LVDRYWVGAGLKTNDWKSCRSGSGAQDVVESHGRPHCDCEGSTSLDVFWSIAADHIPIPLQELDGEQHQRLFGFTPVKPIPFRDVLIVTSGDYSRSQFDDLTVGHERP
jgi:hypothetical protein